MLSRAAERVYWLGRYLERAENTARIVQQYSQLLLDLPEEVGVEWQELVAIFGAGEAVGGFEGNSRERAVLDFLLADPESPNSLAHSIRMARDNVRNSRDLLPQEAGRMRTNSTSTPARTWPPRRRAATDSRSSRIASAVASRSTAYSSAR